MDKIKNAGIMTAVSLICVCIVGGSVLAKEGEYNRGSHIKSRGAVRYADDRMVIDSSDLTYLANEIDDLERSYKSLTVEALNGINTFYASANGEISHEPGDNNVPPDNAAVLSFNDLYQGILQSQSVEHLTGTQAMDESKNPLYYAGESAAESGNLIAVTSEPNEFPLLIRKAAAGNLTAGTAAWVGGTLLIGNGADNAAFYDKGYTQGVEDVTENPGDHGLTKMPESSVTVNVKLMGWDANYTTAQIPIAGAESVYVKMNNSKSSYWHYGYARINEITLQNAANSNPSRTWTKDEIGNATILYLEGSCGQQSGSEDYVTFEITIHY